MSEVVQAQKRFYYMDALNVLACFAVVALHSSTAVYFNEGSLYWRYCVAIQSAFIFAVPIFLMISGANLLGYRKRYSTKEFFKKRMSRILGVFLGCSMLVYVLQCLPVEAFNWGWRRPSLEDFVRSFLDNSIDNIYWYFYVIIGLYLVTPIFSKIADDKRLMEYALVVCAVTSMVFPLVTRFLDGYEAFAGFTYPYLSSWLFYYFAGYYLNTHLDKRIPFPALLVAMVCSIAIMFVMTVHTNDIARMAAVGVVKYDGFYTNALGLPAAALSMSLFVIGKQLNEVIGSLSCYSAIKGLSALSLGIYAMHMQVRNVIGGFLDANVEHCVLLKAIVIYVASAALVFVYRLLKAKAKKTAAR